MSEKGLLQTFQLMHEGVMANRTAYSPEKIILGPGSEIVVDVTDDDRTVGLLSAEGRSGFLVATENGQAQFLEMPSGLFSEEHAHSYGFIIYTVKGRWVLCSNGKRCVMGPGSIYTCRANVSMGMEVPFDEGAFLLFFLEGGVKVERRYEDYLRGVSEGTIDHKVTTMTHLQDLPDSHPARSFARKVNPEFFKSPSRSVSHYR